MSQTCARSARVAQHKKEADNGVRKTALVMVCASIQPSPREACEATVPSGGQGQMLMVVRVPFLRPKPRAAPGFRHGSHGLQKDHRVGNPMEQFSGNKFQEALQHVGAQVLKHDEKRRVRFGRVPDERDLRVRKIFGRKAAIWSDEQEAQHVLRVVCRARLLSCVLLTRRDTEGIEQVDVDASGSKSSRTGAKVSTQTSERCWRFSGQEQPQLQQDASTERCRHRMSVLAVGTHASQARGTS